jgi:hypothetical protein
LVWLKNFQVQCVWRDFPANRAIAVRSQQFVIFPAYQKPYLAVRPFDSSDMVIWELTAPDGRNLSILAEESPGETSTRRYVPFQCIARDNRLYVYDQLGIYELPQ